MATALDMSVRVNVTAPDPIFAAWSMEGLVWLPERGIGYLPVDAFPYDEAEYFRKYQGYAATEMGKRITRARLELVARHIDFSDRIVDVGIGCGDFLSAAHVEGFQAFGFDVSRHGLAWLKEHGLFRDPMRAPVEVLTFWDSLEHIPTASEVLSRARSWAFLSLPIVPGDGPPPLDWKHLRRDEHCWYWTRAGLVAWMAAQRFELVEETDLEVRAGRVDIGTFAFRRIL